MERQKKVEDRERKMGAKKMGREKNEIQRVVETEREVGEGFASFDLLKVRCCTGMQSSLAPI